MAEVKIEGLKKLNKDIQKYKNQKPEELARILNVNGAEIQGEAKNRAPVDTGRLRSSLAILQTATKMEPSVIIGTNVNYAKFVEWGTNRMQAQPFLFPAYQIQVPRIIRDISQEMGDF